MRAGSSIGNGAGARGQCAPCTLEGPAMATTTLYRCDGCDTPTAPTDLRPGAAHFNVCGRCRLLEAAAFAAGAEDGRVDTYDCRPFADFSTFTAYQRGRASVIDA